MKIATHKMSVKFGTVPWGGCKVRSVNKEIKYGDVVWVQQTAWGKIYKGRVYEVLQDLALIKVVHVEDFYTWEGYRAKQK